MEIKGVPKCSKRLLRVCTAVLSTLIIGTGGLVHANEKTAPSSEIYSEAQIHVNYEVTSQGVDVTLDNQSDVDVESVELRSNDIPNLTINQNVQRVERVSAGESKTFAVTYKAPGALDQNANTSPTSLRILPRTGGGGLLLLAMALLMIIGATGLTVLLVRRRRNGKENIIIGLVLAGSVLLTGGLVSGRVAAEEQVQSRISVPIKADFTMGQHAYQYRGEISFNVSDCRVVEESVEKSIPFEKEIVYDETLPVLKVDGSDNVFVKTEGVEGVETRVYRSVYRGSKLVEQKLLSQAVTKESVAEITVYGSMAITRDQDVPYDTTYVAQPQRSLGDSNEVLSAGTEGKISNIYTRNKKTGEIEHRVEKIAPTARQVGVPAQETLIEEIPFKTIEKEDNNLPKGEREIKVEGVPGERTIVLLYDVSPEDGSILSPREIRNQITQNPVDEVVIVGTGVNENETNDLPSTTQSVTNSEATETTTSELITTVTEASRTTIATTETVPDHTNPESSTEEVDPVTTSINQTRIDSREEESRTEESDTDETLVDPPTLMEENDGLTDSSTFETTLTEAVASKSESTQDLAQSEVETRDDSAATQTDRALEPSEDLENEFGISVTDDVEEAESTDETSESKDESWSEEDYIDLCKKLISEYRDEEQVAVVYVDELVDKADKLVAAWAEEDKGSALPYEKSEEDDFESAWIVRLEGTSEADLDQRLRAWFDDSENRRSVDLDEWTEIGIGCRVKDDVLYLVYVK